MGRKPGAKPCTEEHEPLGGGAVWVNLVKKAKPVTINRVVTLLHAEPLRHCGPDGEGQAEGQARSTRGKTSPITRKTELGIGAEP